MCWQVVQKMESMQRERVSHNTANKPSRTWWQDPLITQVVNMSISPYIDVRMYLEFYSSCWFVERSNRYCSWLFDDTKNGRLSSCQLWLLLWNQRISIKSKERYIPFESVLWSILWLGIGIMAQNTCLLFSKRLKPMIEYVPCISYWL